MSAISSFASAFRGGQMPLPSRMLLTPFQEDLPPGESATAQARIFQYFPDTINDARQTAYQEKPIPGMSHPLYQWTSGGSREISFMAIFTRDRALTDDEKNAQLLSTVTGGSRAFGVIDMRNVDIPSAIGWLRSYTYPEYGTSGKNKYERPRPPRRLILTLPGLRINQGMPELPDDEIRCIMVQCDVSYEGFFNDGTPRIARVTLAFAETIQYHGGVTPVGAKGMRSVALQGYRLNKSKGR